MAQLQAWLEPAIKIIKEFEGFEANAYPDPGTGGDPWTIGWGFTQLFGKDVRHGDTITRENADKLLQQEIISCADTLEAAIPYWAEMNANQKAALISFSWNVGISFYGSSGFSTVSRCLRDKLWSGIPAAFALYVNPGSPVQAGLERRRAAEIALWLKPITSDQVSKLISIAGMVGPVKTPYDFGFKPGDSHFIMDDRAELLTAWSFDGKKLWSIPALARGRGRENEWNRTGTDTPPGLYKLGQLYDDIGKVGPAPAYNKTLMEYGWQFYDLIELENQEAGVGRLGVGLHGGATALGWPGAWAPTQRLWPTLGCIRIYNASLRDKVMPLYEKGVVFVSVFQELAG
jgi:hypothetical protein